mmetsp:Transcript_60583/g.169246  ORF Transcript_60583/g.169246 Transcript_60583/m.169246 type:complete len:259 (+) Transcript_60583:1528-2304(+)
MGGFAGRRGEVAAHRRHRRRRALAGSTRWSTAACVHVAGTRRGLRHSVANCARCASTWHAIARARPLATTPCDPEGGPQKIEGVGAHPGMDGPWGVLAAPSGRASTSLRGRPITREVDAPCVVDACCSSSGCFLGLASSPETLREETNAARVVEAGVLALRRRFRALALDAPCPRACAGALAEHRVLGDAAVAVRRLGHDARHISWPRFGDPAVESKRGVQCCSRSVGGVRIRLRGTAGAAHILLRCLLGWHWPPAGL